MPRYWVLIMTGIDIWIEIICETSSLKCSSDVDSKNIYPEEYLFDFNDKLRGILCFRSVVSIPGQFLINIGAK